ncbi:ABC-F family ATP-binding cassette domain-containing protein [Gluconobacter sphaericus]|uniref:ABC transporter ATP-binding protein n=1 Tax=Gluconobacter sphaericus NBRC 12467 TaxID=1307951 RepID=A0AA37WAY8_9PROT|nr:ABC-F family ATP-binding cassette domain-containing protein [Gluconobacter sphaericus]MBF0886398.1 ABC-F family ATP-binding cassette domain-containing protein [Gluconobacter sphaericus]MBS1086457.1 ABC-F family ATP-binding cassette domain-containing protein [Gluconobacter sphaericus]MBS1098219.1 ABC-F family ATP-binding cassette domain-containing protein [Gluconobacter sphaericus]MBS1100433.1 ABC-F family ATP-binding cassette domain-containing protein [Gluconobacter sphaericus]QQX90867.1 AB
MLQIENLVFNAWGRQFFNRASANLPNPSKVSLVGRNGVGKSTLFKLIKGELQPDSGEIVIPRAARVATVDQEHPATPISLIDTILAADTERAALMAELETADPERMGDIWMRLIEIDADSAPSRAAEILNGLGFSTADLDRPMAEFSGGWRMRVALAAALFAEPDLLLLDEPTNYLDLEGALWLEARLARYPHSALIISHDRELLNNSVDFTLHVTEGKLELYTGGYDDFERQRAEKIRLQSATRAKQEAERAHLQSFVDRFKASAAKAAQAQSRVKRLAKLTPIETTIEASVSPFLLPSPARPLAPPLIRLENVEVGYGDDPAILRDLNLRLDVDDRIGLLGVNGAGKSTFAKMIAGALEVRSGEVSRSPRIEVGWFHQHQIEALDPEQTPLDIMREARPTDSDQSHRSRLAQFGIHFEKQGTKVEALSGGERARLLLNMVAMAAPHLLILDEPTNHLDIDSRRALLDALNSYEGAVILITHDRSLMELVADRLWLAADNQIVPFDGDMDDYARFVIDRAKGGTSAPSQSAAKEKRSKGKKKKAK